MPAFPAVLIMSDHKYFERTQLIVSLQGQDWEALQSTLQLWLFPSPPPPLQRPDPSGFLGTTHPSGNKAEARKDSSN